MRHLVEFCQIAASESSSCRCADTGALVQVTRWRQLVPPDVADAFVQATPQRVRKPQSCSRLVATFSNVAPSKPAGKHVAAAAAAATSRAVSEGNESTDGECGKIASLCGAAVALVGDAAHSFPPGVHLRATSS